MSTEESSERVEQDPEAIVRGEARAAYPTDLGHVPPRTYREVDELLAGTPLEQGHLRPHVRGGGRERDHETIILPGHTRDLIARHPRTREAIEGPARPCRASRRCLRRDVTNLEPHRLEPRTLNLYRERHLLSSSLKPDPRPRTHCETKIAYKAHATGV